ncbi:MAG TPA: MFS transporter [Candidatus Sulfomarinibacteraceae bacterium]|nr:MFS transporter [Candidatus Sulfomarinibacteraceae bacterium]
MLKSISRNNRVFMLGNFIFALSYGLWMNLRQLHLLDLGATPVEIGSVFALVAIAGGLLPLPAGMLTDRIGPKRVIQAAWLIAAAGALTAALARTWPVAGSGYIIFMLCIAANPATVSYVLLNTVDEAGEPSAEAVMATVFASWPAAMIFAPALGGWVAAWLNIQADLWLGAGGLLLAVGVLSLAGDVRSASVTGNPHPRMLAQNRQFLGLAIFFSVTLPALYLGYALAPTYLKDARGFSAGYIGLLYSLSALGTLLFRSVVIKFPARQSFAILLALAGLGTVGLWQVPGPVGTAIAFVMLGAISTTWVVMQASIGRAVAENVRGLALGVTESLYYGGIALASWLAGQLYAMTPTRDLPLIVGAAAVLAVLVLWVTLPPFGSLRTPTASTTASPAIAHSGRRRDI